MADFVTGAAREEGIGGEGGGARARQKIILDQDNEPKTNESNHATVQ